MCAMSDLDYDAKLTDEEIENHVCCLKRHLCKSDHFHQRDVERILRARLLDLAQRAEADRATVERVRALLVPTYATASDETWGTNGHVEPIDPDDLRAALDREEDQ